MNATLGRFFEDARDEGGIDIEISDDAAELPRRGRRGGRDHLRGGRRPAAAARATGPDASDTAALPEILTGDFNDQRLTDNGGAITIFFGDPDADIPKPPTATNLAELGAADGASTLEDPETANTTTSVPGETTTTVPGDTTTTVAGGTTSTTAG